ncbi:glycosyltransferase [Patescibacteria group bacterium]|nr:glycosyltransferase [Patescibacteria group bacterium]
MNVLFTGGGSLGPVTPLLAVVRALRRLEPTVSCTWVGTPEGPEKELVQALHIPFFPLPVAKLPRYPTVRWLYFPFDWYRARKEATRLIAQLHPDVIVTAGGFTGVPLMMAARKQKTLCALHQLDLKLSLSNRQIASLCQSITTSFEYERSPFRTELADERIPTPTRFRLETLPTRTSAVHHFGLDAARPVTLIFGGGTGSLAINTLVEKTLASWLSFTQVIHVTGKGKRSSTLPVRPGYKVFELLTDEMELAIAAADLVVSRAGFGTLSEISAALQKPTIVIPLPGTEQELNAKAFEEQGAVIVMYQEELGTGDQLLESARLVLHDKQLRSEMGRAATAFLPTDDGTTLAKRLIALYERRERGEGK